MLKSFVPWRQALDTEVRLFELHANDTLRSILLAGFIYHGLYIGPQNENCP